MEPLVGNHTVNTMPESTIEAFKGHGKVLKDTIEHGENEALIVFLELKQIGIDLKKITEQLVEEGIDKFVKSYDQLLEAINSQLIHA